MFSIVLGVLVAIVASVWLLIARQQSKYGAHLKAQKTGPEKRSKPKPEFRTYTREEVAQHNTPGDAWIIIRDKDTNELKVYDVSEYQDEHPGGEAILSHVGGEATEGFYGPQHPPAAMNMAQEFCIGRVEE